jgi:hypothetical protein
VRTSALTLLITIPLTLGLVACSEDSPGGQASNTSAAPAPDPQVPAGVAAQYAKVEEEIKAEGGQTTVGAWRIAYIVEPAEPWYALEGGQQVFREPATGETHHIEIIPFEAETGRIVPTVPIRMEVLDASGTVVDAKPLNFYYAEFFHYANNFAVPQPGTYTLRATIEPPTFLRHGEHNQPPALADGATATFPGVELKPEG